MRKNHVDYNTVCACCGAEVERYDICEVCGWQDDDVQNGDPDYRGGANTMSLNEAKEAYKRGEQVD